MALRNLGLEDFRLFVVPVVLLVGFAGCSIRVPREGAAGTAANLLLHLANMQVGRRPQRGKKWSSLVGSDDDNWASNCLVQRLDATLLRVSGTPGGGQVRLTLRAGSAPSPLSQCPLCAISRPELSRLLIIATW